MRIHRAGALGGLSHIDHSNDGQAMNVALQALFNFLSVSAVAIAIQNSGVLQLNASLVRTWIPSRL